MFIGRRYELERLSALWRKATSSLVVVSGRRRIGKSTLVEFFAERSNCRFIEIEGLPPDETMTNARQIAHFCERLAAVTHLKPAKADCWAQAFDALDRAVGKTKTVVFLDEISWMGGYDPGFAGFLKNAWDTQLSKHPHLIVVLAGSVSAWIQQNILKSKGFVGRISLGLRLPELNLAECRRFWGEKSDRIAPRDFADILSVTGGIPKYLQEIDPSLSADENVRQLLFTPEGALFGDFDAIFSDVFGPGSAAKRRLLEALADGPASIVDLAERFGVESNGHFSDDLEDLVEAGFLTACRGKNPITDRDVREVRYRLRDNYTRFYLKYVAPKAEAITQGLYRFTALDRLPGWDTIMGLQFENLVVNNLRALCPLIGIGGKLVTSAASYARRKTASFPGVQVDLLIQTPKSVCLVEIKRRDRITPAIEDEIREKVKRLGIPSDKSVRTALVYDGNLAPEVEESGYIDFLIPFNRLLQPAS